jgi:hypothetical protein
VQSAQRERSWPDTWSTGTSPKRRRSGALLHERRAATRAVRARTRRGAALGAQTAPPLGRLLGDPRLGMAGVFLSLRAVLPNRYPLALDAERHIAHEQRLGRMLDYGVSVPPLQCRYGWSAEELGEARLLELVRDGRPGLPPSAAFRRAAWARLNDSPVRSPPAIVGDTTADRAIGPTTAFASNPCAKWGCAWPVPRWVEASRLGACTTCPIPR